MLTGHQVDRSKFYGDDDVAWFAKEVKTILEDATSTPWPVFDGAGKTAFQAFNTALHIKFGLKLWDDIFKLNQSQIASVKDSANPADPAAWKSMVSVVESAAGHLTSVKECFQGQQIYLLGGQEIISELADQVMTYVGLKVTAPPPAPPFPLVALLDILLSPAALAPGEGGMVSRAMAGIIIGLAGFISTTRKISEEHKLNGFTVKLTELRRQLTERFANFFAATTQVINAAAQDYGKLTKLGRLVNDPKVTWPSQKCPVQPAGMKSLEITLWQFFLPARWKIVTLDKNVGEVRTDNYSPSEAEAEMAKMQAKHPETYWELTGDFQERRWTKTIYAWRTKIQALGQPADGGAYLVSHLAPESAKRLFDTLGADRRQLFNQTSGWTGFGTHVIDLGMWGSQTTVERMLGDA